MALLLVVSVFVLNRITDLLLRPLDRLHDGVERVAKGDLSSRQEAVSDDEIGDLARAFNKMTDDLKEYIRNLQVTTANKERIESELKIANEIQASMLPRIFPAFPNRSEFDIYAIMEPAKEIAGDFYDFFLVGKDRLCFVVGDVSGKGVPAALYMVIAKPVLKTQALQGLSPERVLANVNSILCPDNETCMFATVFCAVLDTKTGEVEYSNAGHNPPLLCRAGGEFEFMSPAEAPPLGVQPDAVYSLGRLRLEPRDVAFLYTDGVTEAMDPKDELFSDERLRDVLRGLKDSDMNRMIGGIQAAVRAFARETPQYDDITMLAVRFNGP
jgi:sigma-B regulation protein RsbU (phosphoserine phosphatase)